jgi:hypothetical protein
MSQPEESDCKPSSALPQIHDSPKGSTPRHKKIIIIVIDFMPLVG